MTDKPTICAPKFKHLLGRAIGTRFNGIKDVDRLLRTIHHPDHRQHSWMETVANALPEGPKYHLSTRWFTEWTTWFYGSQDREIHRWISSHARPDWVAFDIGMNYGYFACLLAQRCLSVHGFEPVPWLAKRARANGELNGFRNLFINEVALSDHAGKASLNLPAEDDCNWGTSSLVHQSTGKNSTLEVTLDTLDDYVSRKALERLDFIKIDVEGAEHLVLKGAVQTLNRLRPTIIFERNVESIENIVGILKSQGYQFASLQEEPLCNDLMTWPHDILARK